jgi:hypothetical protein
MRSRPRASVQLVAILLAGFCGGMAAAGCLIDWADECSYDLGYPGCVGVRGTGTGAGATATGTGSSTAQSGGGGTDAGCTDPSSCPPVPPGPCASLGTVTCVDHVCGVTYTAGPAPSQVYGNCEKNLCATDGGLSAIVDTTNVFNTGNPCEVGQCTDGGASLILSPVGQVSCILPGPMPGYCAEAPDPLSGGIYVCAECNPNNQMTCAGVPGDTCVAGGKCVPPHCTNGKMDGNETGVDCGGPDCVPCLTGGGCSTYKDCTSMVCDADAGVCAAPTCTDGHQNGTETDIDCGGASCPRCGVGLQCASPKDCVSKVCESVLPGMLPDVCQLPTCFDGVQNGTETGIDCGGPLDGGGEGDGGAPCPPCGM